MEQMPKHICEKRTYTVEDICTLRGISRTVAYEFC